MSITAGLRAHARRRPDAPALACAGESITYGALDALVSRLAAHVARLPPGGIAIHLRTGLAPAILFLSAARAGREGQMLDPAWPEAMTKDVIAALRPALVVSETLVASPGAPAHIQLPRDLVPEDLALALGAPEIAVAPTEPDDDLPFYVGFTSGSTGMPKGYRRTHRSWTSSFAADAMEFAIGPSDVLLAPGTLGHSLFLYAMVHALHVGAKAVLAPAFRPSAVAALARAEQASVIYGVPTHFSLLLEALDQAGAPPLSGVRRILSSGAKWAEGLRPRLSRHFPKARFAEFYGASELSFVTVAKDEDNVPPGSVGRAFHGVRLSVRDRRGRRLPPGRVGLVYVESPFLFSGYACGEEENLPRLGHALAPGDMGSLDKDGFLTLAGRAKRMIVTSGKNLFPEEVERLLERHPQIAVAGVLGLPDARRGERLAALVALLPGADPLSRAALIAWLKPHLPLYKIPRRYAVVDPWPYTASGKTDFAALARLAPDECEDLA